MLGIIFLLCFVSCACSDLITCPGRENEITDCAIDLTKICETKGCPEGQFCCRYGCGKQTCQSNDTLPGSKCEIGTPKSSINCGRGGVRCDEGFKCNIAPDDRYAVCCPENPCSYGDPLPKTLCNSNKAGCPKGYDCTKTADERYSVCCLGTCSQPKVVGPCEALISRWYYDQKTGTCKHFTYGGCKGNQNNFKTKDACKARCNIKDACSQPKVVGPCRAAFKRWYFNSKTKKCEQFIYGGCQGNNNNFKSEIACMERCDICSQPKVVGPCKAAFKRWYFNSKTKKCEMFIYGGCQGNDNNFMTESSCKETCGGKLDTCDQPKVVGPCRAAIKRWYFNSKTQKCQMFIYGGCKGNDNNFKSEISCKEKCIKDLDPCSQPKVTGPCKAAFKRWFFNSKTQKCEMFIYGGCQGNDNNFNTEMSCMQRCMKKLDQCLQPKKPGPCRGSFPRWYFNWKTKQCERFIYGGCQGNDNNFTSKRTCLKICRRKKDPCQQPKKTGPCKAAIPRWYYDSKTKTCKKFIYGGCQGNDNNFQTESACTTRCTNNLDTCLQQKDPGPCLAAFPRWYFNDMTAKCEKFIYGGCLGNDNNFMTLQACAKACRKFKDPCRLPKKTGPCLALFRRWYFNWKKNRCERFIYGGCQGNKNNFKSKPACMRKCRRKSYKDCQ